MKEVVLEAVRDHIDQEAIDALVEQEDRERDEMAPLISDAMQNIIDELDELED